MNKRVILQQKRQQILDIITQYGATNAQIFGSVARGEETPESDIDFLVELPPDATLIDQIALIQALEDLLECHIDLTEPDSLHSLIKERILQEAIPI